MSAGELCITMASGKNELKVCPYGKKCYRKNPIHFGEFSHPHLNAIYDHGRNSQSNEYEIPQELNSETILQQLQLLEKLFPKHTETHKKDVANVHFNTEPSTSQKMSTYSDSKEAGPSKKRKETAIDIKNYIPVVLEKGIIVEKLRKAAPYNFFLTAITDSKPTHTEPLTITMQEILDSSLGEIECSVHLNFMIDIGWLLGHYYFAKISGTPMIVLYGDDTPELQNINKHAKNVTAIKINMPTPFATHHTKMMLLGYKDGSMRVVISTANLYEDDWHNRTQGLWISPKLSSLADNVDAQAGESPTFFKRDLILYLAEYKLSNLQPWIARIRKSDFSEINVFLICSVPGGFREESRGHQWGHAHLGQTLQKHATAIDAKIPVVCQSSSIGSLGPNIQTWIQEDILKSMRKNKAPISGPIQLPPFKMIYPSFENVKNSHDELLGGGCLPYSRSTNEKQPWLKSYLHHWSSSMRHRSRAMPHIKTYTRFNVEKREVYWFLLTSANLSKAAWGAFNKKSNIQPALRIANYEAGVLFLPQFVTGEETFPLASERNGKPPFPLPYDVPLMPYGPDDKPFLMDYIYD